MKTMSVKSINTHISLPVIYAVIKCKRWDIFSNLLAFIRVYSEFWNISSENVSWCCLKYLIKVSYVHIKQIKTIPWLIHQAWYQKQGYPPFIPLSIQSCIIEIFLLLLRYYIWAWSPLWSPFIRTLLVHEILMKYICKLYYYNIYTHISHVFQIPFASI